MDKIGVMMGCFTCHKVVVPAQKCNAFHLHPSNCNSTTVVECVGSSGQMLEPLVIWKGSWYRLGNHCQMEGVGADWYFASSEKGYISNSLALEWLIRVFEPQKKLADNHKEEWRLLVFDSHGCHVTTDFIDKLTSVGL
ncbi:uncharacterized protein MEPE_03560 [Melanopsichium pennsylvanicum]|uniref:DDE-1 domain-containing protein n=1 Tax=Melanopsichium pennsylvanicum TaxID=63383 RepID=A0AAJ4XN53_9BASI|nr:uncharacterized protein MEPE_03560 [Melanopsichium pennsylvanicum]